MSDIQHSSGLKELYLRNMMYVGWTTAIFVVPFGIYSLYMQRYSISFVALIMISICVLNSFSIKHKRKLAIPFFFWYLIIFAEIILLTTTIGMKGLLWSYPFVFTIFFVQEKNQARIYCAITYVSFVIACFISSEIELAFRFAVTLFMLILLTDVIIRELTKMEDKLKELSIRDPLTNAHNRRYMNHIMQITIEETRRDFGPASLIILDIDYFKKINDKYGHVVGDDVLVKLVELLHKRQRKLDYVFRSGGEEFVLILRNTGLQQALSFAESLRKYVEAAKLLKNETITVSLGVTEYQENETDVEWLHRADELLYDAKAAGRNCVQPAVMEELYN